MHRRVALEPAQDEGAGDPAQALRRVGVAVPLDRRGEAAAERAAGAQQARVEEVQIDHSSSSRFSMGVPVSAIRWRAGSARAACAPAASAGS